MICFAALRKMFAVDERHWSCNNR